MSRNYKSYRKEVEKELDGAIARTLEGIGLFVVGEAQARAPVDTGNLKNSITHQVNERDKSVTIGTPVEYAPYVELGTSRSAAQPYLRPAVENNVSRLRELVKDLLRIES